MGGSCMSSSDMTSYYERNSHIRSATNPTQVFKSTKMAPEFDPSKIKLPREACDSAETPHSRAIIYAEDVTGSMGSFLLSLIKNEFPRLIEETYKALKSDPHIMFMGVGDVEAGDEAPLQVTQFEADLRMLEQLEKIYLEKGGGSNRYESYILPWYFASKHIKMDCWDKRREKGFLFTFGDEFPTPYITSEEISKVFGKNDFMQQQNISAEECLELATEKFHCYHIILKGNAYNHYGNEIVEEWQELMGGNRVCYLSDHHYLPELITSILRMHEGEEKADVLKRLPSDAERVIRKALEYHEGPSAETFDQDEIEVF